MNAIVLGADGVEMDVQQTKDQGLIIHHDYFIDLGTEISAKIYDLTLGELEDIDLTKWNGVDFTTEKLPTLAEALAFCSGLEGCTVQLELKAPILPDPSFVPRVVEQIRASGLGERLLLVSFRHDLLQQAKELMPELRVGILTLGSLPSMMLPPPVLWKDLGLVNSMDGELDEENCPALKKQAGLVASTRCSRGAAASRIACQVRSTSRATHRQRAATWQSFTWRATSRTVSSSKPVCFSPARASPLNFKNTRFKFICLLAIKSTFLNLQYNILH